MLYAHRAHAQRLDPQAQILRRARRRCQIENRIHRARIETRTDVPLLKPEARMACEMGKVSEISRRQIVHAKNSVAIAQQAVAKVRTKKPGSAGNKDLHAQFVVLPKQWLVVSVS